MLAYRPGVAVSYDPGLTAASLAVAIIACSISFAVARLPFYRAPELGGALFGAGVSAMHYVGMQAFGAEGTISWDTDYVAASVLASCAIGLLAFSLATHGATARARHFGSSGVLVRPRIPRRRRNARRRRRCRLAGDA